mmetsp:Transcript_105338/g.304000  ORF Transcript_105338/g.304000 Transcript_105338/m.304000 type:complete len:457 (+) Transcript_105338:438-1808(+)
MFDLRAIFKLYGSSSDEGYRITLRNLDCLRTEFMPWYEKKLVETHACSMGELFSSLALLLRLLSDLNRTALELLTYGDKNSNAKLVRFSELCSTGVASAVENMPICVDDAWLRTFLTVVGVKAKEWNANFPTSKGMPAKAQECCKTLQTMCAEVGREVEALAVVSERWTPMLEHLRQLKNEVSIPVDQFCKTVRVHTGGRESNGMGVEGEGGVIIGAVYAEALAKRERVVADLSYAVADPKVRRALNLEHESDVLLSKMDMLLAPFSKVATFLMNDLQRSGAMIHFSEKLEREELERLQVAIKHLADREIDDRGPVDADDDGAGGGSGGNAKDKKNGDVAIEGEPFRRGTARLLELYVVVDYGIDQLLTLLLHMSQIKITVSKPGNLGAKGSSSLPKYISVSIEGMRSFDLEMFTALFSDWRQRVGEQRSCRASQGALTLYQVRWRSIGHSVEMIR